MRFSFILNIDFKITYNSILFKHKFDEYAKLYEIFIYILCGSLNHIKYNIIQKQI